MKKLLTLCAVIFAALAVSALAPAVHAATDVTGDWTAQMQGPNGDMTLTFHFKQDGDKITGTVDSPMGGDPIQIQNGKIDGDKVYWETSFNGATIQHDGTISGDEIKATVKSSDGSFPEMNMVLKRAAAKQP